MVVKRESEDAKLTVIMNIKHRSSRDEIGFFPRALTVATYAPVWIGIMSKAEHRVSLFKPLRSHTKVKFFDYQK